MKLKNVIGVQLLKYAIKLRDWLWKGDLKLKLHKVFPKLFRHPVTLNERFQDRITGQTLKVAKIVLWDNLARLELENGIKITVDIRDLLNKRIFKRLDYD